MQNPARLRVNNHILADGSEVAFAPWDLASITFLWEANTNKLYTLIFGHDTEGGIIPELVIANVPGNNVSEGDILLSYSGPWPGEGRIIIFEQQTSYAPNPIARGTTLSYQQLAQAGMVPYISVGTYVVSSGTAVDGPDRIVGGLAAVVRRAIGNEYYVDVTNLQYGPHSQGIRAKTVKRSDAPVSIPNVPNFPIISRDAGHWDLAMQIMANNSNNSELWNSLQGRWQQPVANPASYSRDRLLETMAAPMKITPPSTKLL